MRVFHVKNKPIGAESQKQGRLFGLVELLNGLVALSLKACPVSLGNLLDLLGLFDTQIILIAWFY